jgi:hypothetical protein
LQWNGTAVGEIKHRITEMVDEDDRLIVTIDGQRAQLTRDLGSIALIADELKPIFQLEKIGRCAGTFCGVPIMLHRVIADERQLPIATDYSVDEVKRSLIFRWCLGLVQTGEASLLVRYFKSGIIRVTSYREIKYDYLQSNRWGSELSPMTLSKWFHGDFDQSARALLAGYTLQQLRDDIIAVVDRIDPSHRFWIISILSRAGRYLN